MKYHLHWLRRLLPAALAASSVIAGAAPTHAEAPLQTDLSAARIVMRADGREAQQPAQAVSPGDTVQYSARWRNSGTAALSNVVATLPIPSGTHFLAGTGTRPEGALATTDGQHFEPMPLKRRARKADGQWETVDVPLSEYRAIRWPARTIAAGEAFDVSLRVRVIDAGSIAKVAP